MCVCVPVRICACVCECVPPHDASERTPGHTHAPRLTRPQGDEWGRRSFTVSGAVDAPYFKLGTTSAADWASRERSLQAPWAELATDKIVLTVPSYSIRALSNLDALMTKYDAMMDSMADFVGVSRGALAEGTRRGPQGGSGDGAEGAGRRAGQSECGLAPPSTTSRESRCEPRVGHIFTAADRPLPLPSLTRPPPRTAPPPPPRAPTPRALQMGRARAFPQRFVMDCSVGNIAPYPQDTAPGYPSLGGFEFLPVNDSSKPSLVSTGFTDLEEAKAKWLLVRTLAWQHVWGVWPLPRTDGPPAQLGANVLAATYALVRGPHGWIDTK